MNDNPHTTETPIKPARRRHSPAQVHASREGIYAKLAQMGPCKHWPHKPAPFRWEDSEIMHLILASGYDLDEARRILEGAYRLRIIRYDRRSALWSGRDYTKQEENAC